MSNMSDSKLDFLMRCNSIEFVDKDGKVIPPKLTEDEDPGEDGEWP
jgi:hypothetical protein